MDEKVRIWVCVVEDLVGKERGDEDGRAGNGECGFLWINKGGKKFII